MYRKITALISQNYKYKKNNFTNISYDYKRDLLELCYHKTNKYTKKI